MGGAESLQPMWVRLVTSSLLISHERSLRLPGNRTVRSSHRGFHQMEATLIRLHWKNFREHDQSSSPLVVLLNGQEYVSMQVSQPISIEREPSLIFLLVFPQYFPISPHTLLLPPLATPGVFGTPLPWDSPPLSALDTPFFYPLLPHLPMCGGDRVAPVPEIP